MGRSREFGVRFEESCTRVGQLRPACLQTRSESVSCWDSILVSFQRGGERAREMLCFQVRKEGRLGDDLQIAAVVLLK